VTRPASAPRTPTASKAPPPATPKPPVVVELAWTGGQRLDGRAGALPVTVDGAAAAGLTPVQAVAVGLAGCMGIDVADILRKGRHPLAGLRLRLVGERRAEPPTRFVAVTLHVVVEGAVPEAAVARAIDLARRTYCSVWHSLRQDIAFTTSFEIRPAGDAPRG
jgi:putative redox protein